MAVRSTQDQNRAVRSTQGGGGCHPPRIYNHICWSLFISCVSESDILGQIDYLSDSEITAKETKKGKNDHFSLSICNVGTLCNLICKIHTGSRCLRLTMHNCCHQMQNA